MDETRWTTDAESELHELRARVLDLEVELGRLREEHTALTQLADRIVAFLKTAHGDDSAEAVKALEDAAAEAIAR